MLYNEGMDKVKYYACIMIRPSLVGCGLNNTLSIRRPPAEGVSAFKSPPKTSQLNAVTPSRDSGDAAMPSYSRLSSFIPAMAQKPRCVGKPVVHRRSRPSWKWSATIG